LFLFREKEKKKGKKMRNKRFFTGAVHSHTRRMARRGLLYFLRLRGKKKKRLRGGKKKSQQKGKKEEISVLGRALTGGPLSAIRRGRGRSAISSPSEGGNALRVGKRKS